MNTIIATDDLEQTSRRFQALSDETRLRIIGMLSRGERCVCDLQEAVGAYQSRLSFHLGKLKEAGLVTARREGRWVYYALCTEVVEELGAVLSDLDARASRWSPPPGSCCG